MATGNSERGKKDKQGGRQFRLVFTGRGFGVRQTWVQVQGPALSLGAVGKQADLSVPVFSRGKESIPLPHRFATGLGALRGMMWGTWHAVSTVRNTVVAVTTRSGLGR